MIHILHQDKEALPTESPLTVMWQKDNWGEFEVEWEDSDHSLECAEVKVAQLKKHQQDILENGKKIKELVNNCKVNDKLRLDAIEDKQRSMKNLSIGLSAIAAVLGIVQFSNLLFKPVKRWYLRRIGVEEDTLTEEKRNELLDTGKSLRIRRSRRTKRSHTRQWQIDGGY